MIWHNPCSSVRPPRIARKEITVPDTATVLQLLDLAKYTRHYAAFHFLAHTGVRRGEVCGLMWDDVDLVGARASILRAAVRVKGKGIVMLPPKTERSRRTIALDSETVDVLRAHRGTQLIQRSELGDLYEDLGYIFTGATGLPLDPYVLTDTWSHMVWKAGVTNIRLHDLRHFHASVLLRANKHPKIVQERLGHSTISVTLDTYSHSVPSMQEQAALDFAEALKQ